MWNGVHLLEAQAKTKARSTAAAVVDDDGNDSDSGDDSDTTIAAVSINSSSAGATTTHVKLCGLCDRKDVNELLCTPSTATCHDHSFHGQPKISLKARAHNFALYRRLTLYCCVNSAMFNTLHGEQRSCTSAVSNMSTGIHYYDAI